MTLEEIHERTKKTCEVALHLNKTSHMLSDFTFQCIDQVPTGTPQEAEKIRITTERSILERATIFSPTLWT